jgi:hypothetical protein
MTHFKTIIPHFTEPPIWSLSLKFINHTRSEVLKAIKMTKLVSWAAAPCGLADRQHISPKHWHQPTSPHGITTQKTIIFTNHDF